MKSFKEFVVEKRTTPGFGSPSGYDPQGEPMYTKRPGPREKGRRAEVQRSPKSVTAVKGEIEAAKGFETKSGGLDTRTTDPKYTPKRAERAASVGGDVWKDTSPASGRPFKSIAKHSTSTTLRTRTGGSGRDWLSSLRGPQSSKTDPWKGADYSSSYEVAQKLRNDPREPFGDSGFDQPSGKPSKPEAPKTEVVKQSDISRRAERFRSGYAPENKPKPGSEIVLSKSSQSKPERLVRLGREGKKYDPTKFTGLSTRGGKLDKKGGKLDTYKPPKPDVIDVDVKDLGTSKPKQLPGTASTTKTTKAFLKGLGKGTGRLLGAAGVAYDAASAYSSERAKGSSEKRSVAKSAAKVLGGALGGTLGAIGGGGIGSAALGIAGYTGGSELAGRAFDIAAGATKQQKAAMSQLNRKSQRLQSIVKPRIEKSVTSTGDIVTKTTAVDPSKLAKTKVIKDVSGKERVGYLAKKGGTYGYKTGADPSTLAKTSSNPLERIGRTLMPGAYTQSDEAARKKRVAALKAQG